jgi:hypothetical protein
MMCDGYIVRCVVSAVWACGVGWGVFLFYCLTLIEPQGAHVVSNDQLIRCGSVLLQFWSSADLSVDPSVDPGLPIQP